MRPLWTCWIFLFWLVSPIAIEAQEANWDFSLTNPIQSGIAGQRLVFNGIITNSTGDALVFSSVSLDFQTDPASNYYNLDFTDEFLNTGLVIPSSGYNGSMFFVEWLPSAPADLTGTGTLDLTADGLALPNSIIVSFSAATTATPAPDALITAMMGTIPGVSLLLQRRKWRRESCMPPAN